MSKTETPNPGLESCPLCGMPRGEGAGEWAHLPSHIRFRCPVGEIARSFPALSITEARDVHRRNTAK